MLTFENDVSGGKLEVHGDIEGLEYLRATLDALIAQSRARGSDHVHLMTEAWGGPDSGLSSENQNLGGEIYNHVKILCWNERND